MSSRSLIDQIPKMSLQKPLCQIYTPIGMLGYGFSVSEAHETLAELTTDATTPTAIICDSGSTDSGPGKLATGATTCPRSAYKRDLEGLLRLVRQYKVPLLIGSAGGAGLDSHVEDLTKVIDEICDEHGWSANVVQIFSGIDKNLISQRLRDGSITGCGTAVPELKQDDIDDAPYIVAQMGTEPYLEAMRKYPDADIVLAGRAYDPVPYVAFATANLEKRVSAGKLNKQQTSIIQGGFMHMGKIMECGGLCSTPKSAGAVATLYEDGSFDIRPTAPGARCTPVTVAAHTLYEKSRPDLLFGPGGHLDLTKPTLVALDDGRTVHVSGSTFHYTVDSGRPYQIKLEGARNRGYRSLYMGFIRDPALIAFLDTQLEKIRAYAKSQVPGDWQLDWHIYGRDSQGNASGDVYLVGESIAETQDTARAVVAAARTATIHGSYPGQKTTSGSFGFGIGGQTEINVGMCAEFCIYHLMDLKPGEEASLFPSKLIDIDHARPMTNGHTTKIEKSPASVLGGGIEKAIEPNLKDARTLGDAAKVLRSKNAGPYEITFDVMFDRPEVYEAIKSSGILTTEIVAQLYGLKPEELVWSGFFDIALAYKATIPRKRKGKAAASGGYLEDDVHGSQMYLPLMDLKLPEALRQELFLLSNT